MNVVMIKGVGAKKNSNNRNIGTETRNHMKQILSLSTGFSGIKETP
jgi:hypothetical protein